MLGRRRRNKYGAQYCAVTVTLLLLSSVYFLYSRLSTHRLSLSQLNVDHSRLLDSDADFTTTILSDLQLKGIENDASNILSSSSSGYYFDHLSCVVRRVLHPNSVDDIERWGHFMTPFVAEFASYDDRNKVMFGSDDVPLDEDLRRKLIRVNGIEDTLLLKLGFNFWPLREGWGGWFDAKSDFLRKDRMFKSNLELLNPANNPFLQEPDGIGVTGLTRADKLLQKGLFYEMKKAPFVTIKSLGFSDIRSDETNNDHSAKGRSNLNNTSLDRGYARQGYGMDRETDVRRSKFRTLDNNKFDALSGHASEGIYDKSLRKNAKDYGSSLGEIGERDTKKVANSIARKKSESSGSMYAGGRKWGYFPGLNPYLSFSNFMDSFFRKSKCSMRVFMVWNSPPWMYTVRHRRGIESVLFHHPDACVVVFSETIEFDFFKEFLKDGFKIAVAMPNLEELLKDTPTSIFASVWHEWRSTKFYSIHYSELIRLAALYKYGGMYVDCDIVVLKPISAFSNSVGMEELAPKSPLNGAVMAFSKHSFFIRQCMLEFFSSYDDTLLRWNGADLLTRVAGNLSCKESDDSIEKMLKVQPASIFYPIGSNDIQRYFVAPVTESEKAHQHSIIGKILNESYAFHFWNSLTSAIVPEPYSLVARIMNKCCIYCTDLL